VRQEGALRGTQISSAALAEATAKLKTVDDALFAVAEFSSYGPQFVEPSIQLVRGPVRAKDRQVRMERPAPIRSA